MNIKKTPDRIFADTGAYPFDLPPEKLRTRLCITEVLYNCAIALNSFLTVFLQQLGVTPGTLGIINAVNSVSGVVAPPIWGIVADKVRSCKKIFILCLLATALILFAVPIAARAPGAPIVLVTIVIVVSKFFDGPANNMMESWIVQVANHSCRTISYGSIRLWASIGYAATGLALSPLLKHIDVSLTYYLYALFAVPAVFLARTVPDMKTLKKQKQPRLRDMPFKKLADYWFVSFICFFILFNLPTMWATQFFPFLVADHGGGASAIAAFMAVRAFSEVPTLSLSRQIIARHGLIVPFFAVAALYICEQTIYAFSTQLWQLYLAQSLHGMAAGLMMSCRMQYIHQLAPEGLEATAQTLAISLNTLASILFSIAGGFILEALGTQTFYLVIDVMLIFSALIFAVSFPIGHKLLGKSYPKAMAYRG